MLLGFSGLRCETNIDDCVGHKCENNGTCIDRIESYVCHCRPGYDGEYCETRIQWCDKRHNPCKNGGQCVTMGDNTHYQCMCQKGWVGENCTQNEDNCSDNECQNGGTCVDLINDYRCECPEGFAGKYCQLAPMVELYPQTSPCQQSDCKHGVCFVPQGELPVLIVPCSLYLYCAQAHPSTYVSAILAIPANTAILWSRCHSALSHT